MSAFDAQVQVTKDRFRSMVFRAELPDGTSIREDDLRRELGESVRVVRQALRELAREGLLIRKPRVGTIVGPSAAAPGKLLPRVRSVGILTGYSRKGFERGDFTQRVRRGIEAELQAPRQIVFYSQEASSSGGVDDPPRLETEGVRRSVQGLISVEANHAPTLNELVRAGLPVVAVDYYLSGGTWDVSAVDHLAAGYLATEHLLRLGHRNIAFLGEGPRAESTDPTWQDRLTGYLRAMAEAGSLAPAPSILPLKFRSQSHIAKDLPRFHARVRPSAYVLATGQSAQFALRALEGLSARVPEDVSLACADGIVVEAGARMHLSRVKLDYEDLGENAVRLLAARLACKPAPPFRAILPVTFEAGESSRPM